MELRQQQQNIKYYKIKAMLLYSIEKLAPEKQNYSSVKIDEVTAPPEASKDITYPEVANPEVAKCISNSTTVTNYLRLPMKRWILRLLTWKS